MGEFKFAALMNYGRAKFASQRLLGPTLFVLLLLGGRVAGERATNTPAGPAHKLGQVQSLPASQPASQPAGRPASKQVSAGPVVAQLHLCQSICHRRLFERTSSLCALLIRLETVQKLAQIDQAANLFIFAPPSSTLSLSGGGSSRA